MLDGAGSTADSVPFQVNDSVRLVGDPQEHGIFVAATLRSGRWFGKVRYPSGIRNIPLDQLEPVSVVTEEPLELLHTGRFSDPARLRQVLAHIRLTGRLADVIYSMAATNTQFMAHQFKPVLKMLSSPTGNL